MKKAFAWLEGNKLEYSFHDYKKSGAPAAKLKAWIRKAGWEALVNTKGNTFRQLPPARQKALGAHDAAALMEELPSVIKRPVIEAGDTLLVGFDADKYRAALK